MQFNEKPNVLDKTINFMELLKCNKFQQDKNPFSNLAFDTLIEFLIYYQRTKIQIFPFSAYTYDVKTITEANALVA